VGSWGAPSPATVSDDQCPAGKVAGSSHPATSSCSPTTNKALTAAISAWSLRATSLAALYDFGYRAAEAYPHYDRSDDATRSPRSSPP
jgi:hypothetical protein